MTLEPWSFSTLMPAVMWYLKWNEHGKRDCVRAEKSMSGRAAATNLAFHVT